MHMYVLLYCVFVHMSRFVCAYVCVHVYYGTCGGIWSMSEDNFKKLVVFCLAEVEFVSTAALHPASFSVSSSVSLTLTIGVLGL